MLVAGLLLLPLLVASLRLLRDHSAPVFDMALIEMRVRDVGTRHAPLLGLGGRLSRWPEVGCHPGPLSFYALAPVYRLLGGSYWALRVSGIVLNAIAIVLSLAIARRRAGTLGVVAIGAVLAALELGFGYLLLALPWNPYVPVFWFVTFLLATWSVVAGDVKLLPAAMVIGTLCAQTHISYLPVCGGLSALAFLFVAGRWTVARRRGFRERDCAAACVLGAVALALAWAPPVLQQLTSERGNLSIVFGHFRSPPEPVVGAPAAVKLLLQRLDVGSFLIHSLSRPGVYRASFGGPMSATFGSAALAVWLASAVAAVRAGDRSLRALHAILGTALVLAFLATSRIVGIPFSYVLFFVWGIAAGVLFSIVVTFGLFLRTPGFMSLRIQRWVAFLGTLFIFASAVRLIVTVDVLGDVGSVERAAKDLGELASGTAQAIKGGALPERASGDYVVTWDDALYRGAPGYGLLVELERRGIRAFLPVSDFDRALVGVHRVMDPKRATARIHYANGAWVYDARKMRGAVQVAYVDGRTAAEREEYPRMVSLVAQALVRTDHLDAAGKIERNLSLAFVPGLSLWERMAIARLSEIGMPTAVFILPAP